MLFKIAKETPDKELLILGFVITNPEMYKKLRDAWNKQLTNKQNYLGRSIEETKKITSDMLGGELILIDPKNVNGDILGRIKIKTPMGMVYSKKQKTLFVGSDHVVYGISRGRITQTINNRLFNCIHSLHETISGNLLVVSTGIDAIIEINLSKLDELVYTWLATENGYTKSVNGNTRIINQNMNYQWIEYATPEHTTHVNSIVELNEKYLLATFFHQGYLVKINKLSGKVRIILSGLKQPHNIRKTSFGYLLSDTNEPCVIKINNKLEVIDKIKGDFNWIQDSIELKNGNTVIADSNNGRVVIVDASGHQIDELNYGGNKKRIGILNVVKAKEALYIFNC